MGSSDVPISHVMQRAAVVGITGPRLPHQPAHWPGRPHLATAAGLPGLGATAQHFLKSLLGAHLPLSYWPYQVTKLAQLQGVKEEYTSFNGGNYEVI